MASVFSPVFWFLWGKTAPDSTTLSELIMQPQGLNENDKSITVPVYKISVPFIFSSMDK
jgi:hypothetical protein